MEPELSQTDKVNAENYYQTLKSIPFFAKLNLPQFQELTLLMREVSFQPGDIIVKKGDIVSSIYIILKGRAEVFQEKIIKHKKKQIPICILQENETIGLTEKGFFSHSNFRTATVIAQTAVKLLILDIHDLHKFLHKHPAINASMEKATEQMLRLSFIKQTDPFTHLSQFELSVLNESIEKKFYIDGEIIFRQGDISDRVYLILNGQVEILIDVAGKEHQIALLDSGDIFGEQAILMEAPRNATARALTACALLSLKRETFLQLWQKEEKMKKDLVNIIIERQRPMRKENISVYEKKLSDENPIYILINEKGDYFRLTQEGWFIWQQLDGNKSLQDLTKTYLNEFKQSSPEVVIKLITDLTQEGFIDEQSGKLFKTKEKLSIWTKAINKVRQFLKSGSR